MGNEWFLHPWMLAITTALSFSSKWRLFAVKISLCSCLFASKKVYAIKHRIFEVNKQHEVLGWVNSMVCRC